MKLTMELWRGLVADHLRRAWVTQWTDKTDVEMDYCGERLIADRWTAEQSAWCVKRVVQVAYSPKGILASLSRVNEGDRDRHGETVNGWERSSEYAAVNQAVVRARERQQCITDRVDGHHN